MITSACSTALSVISHSRKAHRIHTHCLPAARFHKRSGPMSATERTACVSIAMSQSSGSTYRLSWTTLSPSLSEERVPRQSGSRLFSLQQKKVGVNTRNRPGFRRGRITVSSTSGSLGHAFHLVCGWSAARRSDSNGQSNGHSVNLKPRASGEYSYSGSGCRPPPTSGRPHSAGEGLNRRCLPTPFGHECLAYVTAPAQAGFQPH